MRRRNLQFKNKNTSLLDAVAFQDHYSKTLKLNTVVKPLWSKRNKTIQLPNINPKSKRIATNHRIRQRKDYIKKQSKPILDKLNYKDILGKKLDKVEAFEEKNREKRLKDFRKRMTLAEKRGLVEGPTLPTSEIEWRQAFKTAKHRLKKEPLCSICLNNFGTETQVLLSCTHVFHKTCLKSYEKHSGERKCPLCRKKNYEKTNYYEGARIFITKSAIKIQSLYRMFSQHSIFLNNLIKLKYVPKSIQLKHRITAFRLDNVTRKMYRNVEQKNKILNKVLEEFEINREKHENLMKTYEENARQLLIERNEQFEKIYDEIYQKKITREALQTNMNENIKWRARIMKVLERGDEKCSICYHHLDNARSIYITSCTHIFHGPCLASLERYSDKSCCPLCRSDYQKLPFLSFRDLKKESIN